MDCFNLCFLFVWLLDLSSVEWRLTEHTYIRDKYNQEVAKVNRKLRNSSGGMVDGKVFLGLF